MSNEQVGMYIRLICAQHQTGHLTEEHMLFICKRQDDVIWSKFEKDESGRYFNKRCEEEVMKRKNYSISRSNNRKKKDDLNTKKDTKDTNHIINISKTYDKHMEDENENENINGISIIKKEEKIIESEFERTFSEYLEMRKKMRKPATGKAIQLVREKLKRFGPEEVQIKHLEQSILNGWQDVYPLKNDSKLNQTEVLMKQAMDTKQWIKETYGE